MTDPPLAQQTEPASPDRSSAESLDTRIERDLTLNYLLTLPEGYAPEDPAAEATTYPLVIFLHGAGERGNDLDKLKFNGPPRLVNEGRTPDALRGAFLVSPQCPEDEYWTETFLLDALDQLLLILRAKHRIDPSRIYLTGLSMGGYGTWAWAGRDPDTFAAIAPICGGGYGWSARRIGRAKLPVWAFHGDRDPVVPLAETLFMFNAVNAAGHAGPNARLTVYPNTGHDSWTVPYQDPALWDWLFGQQRELEPPPANTP